MDKLLIVFVKNPKLGKVKSRLADSIGAEKALSVYKKLLITTKQAVKDLSLKKLISYSDFIDDSDLWENDVFSKSLQVGDDLGQRMWFAMEEGFNQSFKKVCLIGSDTIGINQGLLERSFDLLDHNDLVIGPSLDGGYYLIGMNSPYKSLFDGISWSTDTVLDDTIQKVKEMNLIYKLLPELNDIDVIEDISDENRKYLLS